jgi:hypothetical protein
MPSPKSVFKGVEPFGLSGINQARKVEEYGVVYVTMQNGKLCVMGELKDDKYSVPGMRSLAAPTAVGTLASLPHAVPTLNAVSAENTQVIGEIPMRVGANPANTAVLVVYTTCRLHNGRFGDKVYYHVSLDSASLSNHSVAFMTRHGPLNTKECPVLTSMLDHWVIHGIENPP